MTVEWHNGNSDAAFLAEVRQFIDLNLPDEMAARTRHATHWTREDILDWTAILSKRGWSVPHWPEAYGGTGWSQKRRHLFEEAVFASGAPPNNMQAISLVGPVIYTFGTEEQKGRFLPAIREGKTFWAQGFSEPNAGSDLASLKTRAVRDGAEYVINGQKIWTSQAFMADWLFLLVRTNPDVAKKQAGLSFILVRADTPGITIRPIPSIDGGVSLCETFLNDVRVPVENLVGEEGMGWSYANFLLGNERTTSAEVPRNKAMLARVKELARARTRNGRPLIEDPVFANRLATLQADIYALETSVERVLEAPEATGAGRPTASTLKLRGTEILQALLSMQVDALGPYGAVAMPSDPGETRPELLALPGLADANHVTSEYLYRRAATIYGGTSEIQRTIIARALLKLDPAAEVEPDDDRRMIADGVRRFCGRAYDFETRRKLLAGGAAAVRENWTTYAEMGWLAMGLPENLGGIGSAPADIALVQEHLGGALALEPYLAMIAATKAIEIAAGTEGADILASIAEGELVPVLAHDEFGLGLDPANITTTAKLSGDEWVLSGHKSVILGAPFADALIVSARTAGASGTTDGITLFKVAPDADGLTMTRYTLQDARDAADVHLDRVRVSASNVIGPVGQGHAALTAALEHAAMGLCAESMGAMEKALWTTRDYVTTREQFGQPLSNFQAVQHKLADMFVDCEQARSMLTRGLKALSENDTETRARAISAAKAYFGKVGTRVGETAVQLHGGIGIADEHIVGHFLKRLKVSELLFGSVSQHQARARDY